MILKHIPHVLKASAARKLVFRSCGNAETALNTRRWMNEGFADALALLVKPEPPYYATAPVLQACQLVEGPCYHI